MQKIKKYINKPLTACLSLAMIASNIAPVAATNQVITENNNAETEVTYNKTSSFSVTIPKSISLGNDKQSNYSVKVEGDISSDQEVSVTPVDTLADLEGTNFYMKDQSTSSPKADVLATITQNKTIWNFQDIADSYEETNNTISAEHLTSGTWKGSFDFNINLQTVNDNKADDPYPTVPAEAHLNWNYTLNESEKTITLNYYTGDETDVIVYGSYEVNGQTYQTRIASNETNSSSKYMFAGKNNIETITFNDNIDTNNVISMNSMFCGCNSLISVNFGNNFNTSNVRDMSYMFFNCRSLNELDLSNFNTANVTSMRSMFYQCRALTNIDISNFDTSNVKDMSNMFESNVNLNTLDVRNFNTQNVTDMTAMFSNCLKLASIDVINFNTSNVTNMNMMFYNCYALINLDLFNFDSSKVTNMYAMFSGCKSLESLNVSSFDTSNVTNMSEMFKGCTSLTNLDLNNFDTSKVTTVKYIFADCPNLKTINVTTGKWDTSQANVNYMFENCGTSEVTYI